MKRFNEFVKRLSLTQQLFALIFFFVTFFAVFFFVYINGNVTTVIREQMYGTLDSTLQSWAMSDSTNDEQRQLINSAAGIDIFMVRVDKTLDGATHVTLAGKNTSDMDLNSSEWKAIAQDILSINYGLTINEILSGRKLTTEEYKEMAESNIRETLKASTFELKEKQEFFKKKWRREHISTIIACTVAWIVLIAALIIQNVEAYLCGTIGSLLAIIYYCVLNNRMLAYVEDHIYGGKWNEYKSDSDNK